MSNLNDETDFSLEEGERCFRFRNRILYFTILGLILFSVFGVWSTLAPILNTDGSFGSSDVPGNLEKRVLFSLVYFVVWSFASILSIYGIRASLKTVLILGDDSMIYRNRRDQKIRYDEIESTQWHRIPAQVKIRTATEKLKIEILFFPEEQQKEIVNFLHDAIDPDVQEHWDFFEKVFFYVPKTRWGRFSKLPVVRQVKTLAVILISTFLVWLDLGHLWIIDLTFVFTLMAVSSTMLFLWDFPEFWKAVRRYRDSQKERSSVSE